MVQIDTGSREIGCSTKIVYLLDSSPPKLVTLFSPTTLLSFERVSIPEETEDATESSTPIFNDLTFTKQPFQQRLKKPWPLDKLDIEDSLISQLLFYQVERHLLAYIPMPQYKTLIATIVI